MVSRLDSVLVQISTESVDKFVDNCARRSQEPSESVKFINLLKKWAERVTY